MTEKFTDPLITATGKRRAWVDLTALKTLWFNTGTLCNLTCANCYIESSPKNDRLVYLTHEDVCTYLDEITDQNHSTEQIGITGGEPFMNPDIIKIMETCLQRGFRLLVLTNAMRPMEKHRDALLRLHNKYGTQMTVRVSVDHFDPALHEEERGAHTWKPMIKGLRWLSENGFHIDIAGRTRWGEDEETLRAGFAALFKNLNMSLNAYDPKALMLFPEMDMRAPVPEITTACWNILGVSPDDMMCATSRMVVKRKGADKPAVLACTLLAYDQAFELGETLSEAAQPVHLNHPHCARFCVLGGGTCSAG